MNKTLIDLSPAHIIIASFLILISCGTLLLSLPFARTEAITFIDLFFTATSATCVTGLFTISLTSFTIWGKLIILALIQVGAIGLTTMSFFILSLFVNLGIASRSIAGQLLELDSWHDIKKILLFITIATLGTELIGALFLFTIFAPNYPFAYTMFYSLFHSIASFCNSGISFLHSLAGQNLELYSTNYLFMSITGILIFFGGIGFITWHEVMEYIYSRFVEKKPFRFSLHSKVVLSTSALLFAITACTFLLLEYHNIFSNVSLPLTIAQSLFYAVSLKSCGFFIANFSQFHLATLLFILIIAFIGSSPGSTGSGIKITTLVVCLYTIKGALKGRYNAELFGREIPLDQVYKAFTIVFLSISWILMTTFLLLIIEQKWTFFEILFHTVSAFSNLGSSLKGSEHLSYIGKLLIIATMLVGRIGSLTFILGLKLRKKENLPEFSYPEERLMLG